MKKDQFNKLDIDKQIEYFNQQLLEGKSLTNICKSISIGRSTISDRFKKANYKYNGINKQYELVENNANNTDVMEINNVNNTDVTEVDNGSCTTVECIENTLDIVDLGNEDIKNNLLSLASEYEILKDMIEDYRRRASVIKQQITIDIPEDGSKITTLRINNTVLNMFNEFAEANKQYRKVDLLSQALFNFIKAHE